ncbi:diguanylate cyclase domain-containing protein [Tardiphaga sp.]|uniref:diguanylate cyclase domain-containing protein n=1 Tax=Tardiphaga sp. TaxID=1926292 RepID=UPI0037DA233F
MERVLRRTDRHHSAGVATLRPGEPPESLLARADLALYAAKERGRNRIAAA